MPERQSVLWASARASDRGDLPQGSVLGEILGQSHVGDIDFEGQHGVKPDQVE
jgi:hypothetical protein